MIERKDLAGWLDGPPLEEGYVKGSAIGLPAAGPGSVAPFGRRVLGLCIDWAVVSVLAYAFFDQDPAVTLMIFAAMNLLLITLFGMTIGQFVVRVRVTPVRGRMPMVARATIRTLLIMLVIPGVVWNRDAQPVQDVAAGTAVVRV